MNEFSNEFSEPMTISPTARKLAERYGVSPEVMEEIISDTRSRTDIPRPAAAPVHTPQTIHTVHEQPVAAPIPITPSVVAAEPMVAPPVMAAPTVIQPPIVTQPVVAPPVVVPPTIVHTDGRRDDNALSAVTVILIILLILALIGLFYLWQTQHTNSNTHSLADTVHLAAPADTTPMVLPIDTRGSLHPKRNSLRR